MAVSNTDDHLRNHGLILTNHGWTLSPMYDVNPNIYGDMLSLNVSADDNSISFNLAHETAEFYDISPQEATSTINDLKNIINNSWRILAETYGLGKNAISRMEPAFALRRKN